MNQSSNQGGAADADAEESKRILDALMSSIPEGIAITGGPPDFPVLRVSQAGWQMAGGERPGMTGVSSGHHQFAWSIFHTDGTTPRPDEMPLYRASRLGEEVRGAEFVVHRPDGTVIFVLVDAVPMRDNHGEIVGAVNCWRDITERKRAEEARWQSDRRLRSVLENSRDVIYRVDLRTGRYEYITPSVLTVLGYSASEVEGLEAKACYQTVHPDDVPMLEAAWARLEKSGVAEAEYRQRTKSGEYRWFSNRMSLVRDEAGRPLFRDGSLRDVTEQKTADARSREREERLRLALEAGRMATWDWHFASGQVIWNDEHYRMLGYEPGSIAPSYAAWADRVHPDDRAATEQLIECAIKQGGEYKAEFRLLRPDGSIRWVEARGRIDLDLAGHPTRQYGVMLDVTESKLMEHAHRESEQRLSAVMDALPVGVAVTDTAGGTIKSNAAFEAIWGAPRPPTESVADYGAYQAWWADTDQRVAPEDWASAKVIRTGHAVVGQHIQIQRFDGSRAFVINSAAPVRDAEGAIAGSAVALQDVTDLRRAEQALREADHNKSQFLAVLSHELRNPLTPIRNSLYIFDRAAPGGEQAARAKAIIERQVNQLARLVDDLLDVTRLTQGKLRCEQSRIDLVGIVRRTVEDHRRTFENVRVALVVDVRVEDPVWVKGDDTRLAQTIGNLLSNASKFTRAGDTVTLSMESEGPNTIVIRVRDTGIGIEKQHLPRLFEPFMQADRSIDRSKGGLGLGLSLVKGVVEMHGGSIEAHSDGPGTGADFVIRLPVEIQPVPLVDEKRASRCPSPQRILVIEDNVDAADSLRDLLELGGHQVELAYDGPAGVEKARAMMPDLVLCDIGLPGFDGYAVAKALRLDQALQSMRIVALTGYALPEDVERAMAAGFDGHIAKPPTLKRIEEVLAARNGVKGPAG